MQHRCNACGSLPGSGFQTVCGCGGMIDVEYDLSSVRLQASKNPYVRFGALLPLRQSRDRLPVAGYTPAVHARELGRKLGMPFLYLKNETVLPTGTTKDRMAAISLAYLHESGVRTFCTSSTGNSSTAFAYAIRAYPDMHLFLFSAEKFVPRVHYANHDQVTHYGLRRTTFVQAGIYAGKFARRHGHTLERGFFNPGRREGLKLAFMEAADQIDRPIDWYVQAVSSAMGVYGTYKGARELLHLGQIRQIPRLLCVQQESCAPMVHADREGSPSIKPHHIVAQPDGIAEAILRGDPTAAYPHVRRAVMESGGGFAAVTETEIRQARHDVEILEGISTCFSAAAAVAGLIQQVRSGVVPSSAVVVINLTGSERANADCATPDRWIEKEDLALL